MKSLCFKNLTIHFISILLLITTSGCGFAPFAWQKNDAAWPPPSGDVRLGMSMAEVQSNWGHPRHVLFAGTQTDGNQKWVYPDGSTSSFGLGQSRVIYFEQGRVVGWETSQADSSLMY